MSYGVRIRDSLGNVFLSSDDVGILFLGIISVNPSTSGFQDFPDFAGRNVVVTQVQDKSSLSIGNARNLSAVNVSVSDVGSFKRVSWTPRFIYGSSNNITLFVFSTEGV